MKNFKKFESDNRLMDIFITNHSSSSSTFYWLPLTYLDIQFLKTSEK